jgi:hypothetical protein
MEEINNIALMEKGFEVGAQRGAEWVGRKAIPHHLHPSILIAHQ